MGTTPAYEWNDEMGRVATATEDDVGYEDAVRDMILAGAAWVDENPDADPTFTVAESAPGAISMENDDAWDLANAMCDHIEDKGHDSPSGYMIQIAASHVLRIKRDGWDAYVEWRKEEAE